MLREQLWTAEHIFRKLKNTILRHAPARIFKRETIRQTPPISQEKDTPILQHAWLLGMTSLEEQAYFENYARSIYTGVGEIVDLGCWLGSTTISLARGLAGNPSQQASQKKIHAFDVFTWYAGMDDCVKGTDLEGRYKPEESFLEEFKKRTAPWAGQIEVYAGDLCHAAWNGKDIEFLLIDAMKSWELAESIVRTFYPHLIPKTSYVLHQDFAHWYTSWIHLIQYRLRDYFRFVQAVPHSGSYVFQYVTAMPPECFTTSYSPSSFSEEEIEGAFEYSMGLASDKFARAAIASAKVMLFIHLNDKARATFELEKYISQGILLTPSWGTNFREIAGVYRMGESDCKAVQERLAQLP